MNAATMKERLEGAEVINIWTTPDMTVLNAGRRSPVPMPGELFGPAWGLLNDIAEGVCTSVDYPAMSYLAVCASLIGGKRRVRPYQTSAWAEPCILWCGVVGDPSSRKSPALDAITERLRDLERDHTDRHKLDIRGYQETAERAKASRAEWQDAIKKAVKAGNATPAMPDDAVEPDEPTRRRLMVMDATPEAMGAILAGNPQGTLHFRDELAGWLMSFDRYSPGGREFWLEAYGGRAFSFDRKNLSKGPLQIPFNGVSVLGGIQPAKMSAALLQSPDDGLVARFLWAWPDKLPTIRRPRQCADIDALESVFRRMESLSWGQDREGRQCHITLPLSADAADVFERWEQDNAQVDEDAAALFKSFVGKMNGVVLRLSLVSEMIRWGWSGGPEPREVSADSLIAAAQWVDDYAKPMAERVYGDAALPAVERNASVLARYIRRTGLTTINKRELKQSPHKSKLAGLRDQRLMDEAVEYLVTAGWLIAKPSRDGDNTGRPRGDYAVNPGIHGGK
ncbi:MAG TPA: YfjI family protein [Novosphingobium sp.]|nr:YfjI family protein [Novosphingobium sp.]